MTDLAKLQNGSDIRGIAIATDQLTVNLTEDAVKQIASGLVNWLRQDHEEAYQAGDLTIGVGRDSRLSGPLLALALMEALVTQGVKVIDFGLATTPAMFMATQYEEFACHAGIMITASHLPYYFNGIKIFSQKGGAEHEDIDFILEKTSPSSNGKIGSLTSSDIITPYSADLVGKIRQGSGQATDKPLAGMKIIVDAGNGAGGFFASQVFNKVIFREGYFYVNVITSSVTDQLIFEARDEAARTNLERIGFTFATIERLAIDRTSKVDYCEVILLQFSVFVSYYHFSLLAANVI